MRSAGFVRWKNPRLAALVVGQHGHPLRRQVPSKIGVPLVVLGHAVQQQHTCFGWLVVRLE
jgi:hypothetical protein